MDTATILGIIIAFATIFGGSMLEEVLHGLGLWNPPAAIIVFGGTIGATMTSFRMSDLKNIGKYFRAALRIEKLNITELIGEMVRYAEMARKEGLLTLEETISNVRNQFLKKGIQLIVDGTDPALVRDILEIETEYMEERHKIGIEIFKQAGGYAPTMGIIGTVLGLISALGNLKDTAGIGPRIAIAFVATFYGVFSANILWLPLAKKLQVSTKEEISARQIIIEGILAIQAGEHPRVIGEKLISFLPPAKRPSQAKTEGFGVRG
ncbi:MAG: flagellar motor protein [Firmicutes bacterium]|nr:flagellar motor protein [Bacillota bacterium]